MESDFEDIKDLQVKAIIGFDGSTIRGLMVHPDGIHLVYPIGNKISILNWITKEQHFLNGHTNIISAIDVSRSGKYVASGQINHIGFKTRVILWDFEKHTMLIQHELHKVRIEALCFSHDDNYLISMGGRDDCSTVVWDIRMGCALCGSQVSKGIQGLATALLPMNRRGACFITGGDNHLVVWQIDREARDIRRTDVNCRKLRRSILCMDTDERDSMLYCGTTTGDVLKVRLNFHHDAEILSPVKMPIVIGCFCRISKKKLPWGVVDLYGQGVRSLRRMFGGPLLIGAGDGTLEVVEEMEDVTQDTINTTYTKNLGLKVPSQPVLKIKKTTNLKSSITSIQMVNNTIFAATMNCEIFTINMDTFDTKLVVTCHVSTIYDISFPFGFSDVFATAAKDDVRVWSAATQEELLRIRVQNLYCSSVVFSKDGKSILTAWNDGVIRSFTPLTGRLIFAILNAHNKGCSALATTQHGRMLLSGGCEGQVRVWNITPYKQTLECVLKEHKGPISSLHINHTDDEAVSASTDGSCIIWDIVRMCRRQILFANTLFMCAKFYPTSVQILTCGSDRKVTYWEVLDGSLVRELEGSRSGALNALDISPDGQYFATGGNDQMVKLWRYQEGVTTHVGLGHSAVITAVRFSPDGAYLVTVSSSGSVFVWKVKDVKEVPKEEVSEGKIVREMGKLDLTQAQAEDIRDIPTTRSHVVEIDAGECGPCGGPCLCENLCDKKASSKSCCSLISSSSSSSKKSTAKGNGKGDSRSKK